MKNEALGVDIGNVTLDVRATDQNDKDLYENRYSTIPAVEGVIESLKKLNEEKFHGNIFFVSKCTEWAEVRILQWLKDNNIYEKTGIPEGHAFFCRERHEKEAICAANNINYFVDDRLEVLSHLVGTVQHLYLFRPDQEEVEQFIDFLPDVTRVENWQEAIEKILTT